MIVCDTAIKPVTSSLSGDTYKVSEMTDYLKNNVKSLVIIDGKTLRECETKTLNVAQAQQQKVVYFLLVQTI